jgi:DNA polymerase-1
MSAMAERTLVVAATNLLVRGFAVVPTDRRSPDGAPVNALFAVARALQRAFAFKIPRRAIAVMGGAAAPPDWPGVLAQQLPHLRQLLEAMGIHVVDGASELHVAASYVRAALAQGDDVVVVGVDKRLAQLVSDRVWWYDANKDARYTPEMVVKRFGVPPAQLAEWLALVGNRDDGLPGIPGVGAKGATGLLSSYTSVEAAMQQVEHIPGRTGNALRTAGRDAVMAEVERARLDDREPLPIPVEQALYVAPPVAAINLCFERFGFVELLVSGDTTVHTDVCESIEQLHACLGQLGEGTVALHPLIEDQGDLAGVALSTGNGAAIYVPFFGVGACLSGPHVLAEWLGNARVPKIAHFREALMVALHHLGLTISGMVGDSAFASHLTQPSNWAPHDLTIVAKHVLGRALPEPDTVRGVGNARVSWARVSVERAAQFAGHYADAAAAVWRTLSPALDPTLLAEYLELSDTVVRMELAGLAIDLDELARAEASFAAIESELSAQIASLAGHSFNINSSKQLGHVLFEELKLPVVSHTKTGWSTSVEALERIEHAHPIVALVLRWRLLRRLRDNWIVSLRKYVARDGRVHSRFHPARSFSGRLVNTNPDLSRVPARTPEMARIRRAFVARSGWVFLSVDYDQLGLHVLAHLSQDPELVRPLLERADIHSLTASAVLEKPAAEISVDERQLGKVVNFATFAGQGASALALQLNISAHEAKELIGRFDRRYAKVRAFQDEQLRLARERGFVVTLAGRRWPIGGLESLDPHDRSYAERLARRATHEGSVSDVSRRGLLDADRALRRAGLAAQPVAQILDEVLFEVPREELDEAARIAGDAMRNAFAPMEVPLVVSLEAGPTWADLSPLLRA